MLTQLIQKVRDCIKDIGYDQDGFTWKEATKIDLHHMTDDLIECYSKSKKLMPLLHLPVQSGVN